jgi:hypothetical protein
VFSSRSQNPLAFSRNQTSGISNNIPMKTYVVQFPKNETLGHEAIVDSFLRGFELAIKAASKYRWISLNLGNSTAPRWFDTDCEAAAFALKLELSNIGVEVSEQPPLPVEPISWEAWNRAAQRSW